MLLRNPTRGKIYFIGAIDREQKKILELDEREKNVILSVSSDNEPQYLTPVFHFSHI